MSSVQHQVYSFKHQVNIFVTNEKPKSFKELNFQKIEETAKKSFELLQNLEARQNAFSFKENVKLYQNLSGSLKQVADHIHQSKSLWKKFLSLFINLNLAEQNLNQVIKKTNAQLGHFTSKESHLWVYNNWIVRGLNFFGLDLNKMFMDRIISQGDKGIAKLKDAAFRVIGEHRVVSKEIEGMEPIHAIENIRKQIDAFLKEASEKISQDQVKELNKIKKILCQAEKFREKLIVMSLLENEFPDMFGDKIDPELQKQRIKDFCYDLKEKIGMLKSGEFFVVPGGYVNKSEKSGHAVSFEIAKNENGTCTFTLVNTGEGVGHFSGIISNLFSAFTNHYHDYVIDNLSVEEVADEQFWAAHVALWNEGEGSIEKMFKNIVERLAKNDLSKIAKGKSHWIQTNGTCAYDSLICWMEGKMDPLLFQSFMLFSTQNGLTIFSDQEVQLEAQNIKATVDGSYYQGIELLKKLYTCGLDTASKRKEHFTNTLAEEEKQRTKFETQMLDIEKSLHMKKEKLKKWKSRQDPLYLNCLQKKVDTLDQKCNELDPTSAGKGIFAFMNILSAEAKTAYNSLAKAKDDHKKMTERLVSKKYKLKIAKKIQEKQSLVAKTSKEWDLIRLRVADNFKRIKGAKEIYASLYRNNVN